jgi:uncharacterized protein with beta-barrel porin domain
MKKLTLFLSVSVVAMAAASPKTFAQQTIGVGTTPLSGVGSAQGVAITAGTNGTLTVGTQNIFTNNSVGGVVVNPALPAVANGSPSQGNIIFNGTSNVFGTAGQTPTNLLLDIATNGGAGTAVNFFAPVFDTTLNVNGAGSVNFLSAPGTTNYATAGAIFGADGTIRLAPNVTLVGAITTTAGTNTGNLILGAGSGLTGAVGAASASIRNITVAGGNNTAGVSASISGAVFAYGFNLGTNTLNIGGQLTIADSTTNGVINTTLASPTVYGNIRVVGATTYATGLGALGVQVTVPATALIPVGTQFNIVSQTGAGTPGTVIKLPISDPSNPLYTFSQVPAIGGTVNGLVAIVVTGVPLQVAPSPVVPVIVGIAGSLLPGSTLYQAAAAINALTNPIAIANASAQLAPSAPDLSAPLVAFQATEQFQNLWMSRLDDVMCGQVSQRQPGDETSTCRREDPHDGWWMKGFAYFGSQGSRDTFTGYDSRTVGTMVAYDTPLFRDEPVGVETRVGVGIGYAQNQIDGNPIGTGSSDVDFNSYQATAYISHERGPWFVQGDVSLGWNDYSGRRNISFSGFNQTANSGFNGQNYTAFMTTGYHFLAREFTITPLASLQYTHINIDGYSETGAGDVNLKVNSQSYDFVESGLGAKVARPFLYRDGTYVPEVHFKWLHELYNPTLKNTAAFAAAPSATFTTSGFSTADDTFDIGTGITLLSCSCSERTWSLEAVYDHYWRSDSYSAEQGMLKFTSRF